MARLHRSCPPGYTQHVIQRGNNRAPCCGDDADRYQYIEWLSEYAQEFAVAVHAWVLMTNHVHLLATPSTEGGLSRLMQFLRKFHLTPIRPTRLTAPPLSHAWTRGWPDTRQRATRACWPERPIFRSGTHPQRERSAKVWTQQPPSTAIGPARSFPIQATPCSISAKRVVILPKLPLTERRCLLNCKDSNNCVKGES